MYFSVREPEAKETPVVVEVPHAGLSVDPESLATLIAPARALARDADLYVDELFADAPAEGATLLVALASRYICDLNRGENDFDASAAEGGESRAAPHGLVWRTTTDDQPALTAPLSRTEMERRLSLIYRPYHARLAQILSAKRERFGFCILLCGHSMPSRGRAGHADPGRERADIVPGTRGRSTAAPEVIEVVDRIANEHSLSVAHDDPYRGGFTTHHYGHPAERAHAIQVEVSRRLYMNEQTLTKKHNDFAKTRAFCRALVARLGSVLIG